MKQFPIRLLLLAGLLFTLASASLTAKPHQKIKVACVGNSITYGTGIRDRAHDSYPAQLQRMLGDAYEVGNFGKPSATLLRHGYKPYFNEPEFRQAMQFAGDIAIIHLGINDTDPRCWANYRDEFVGDYLALIDSLKKANPRVRILVARLTPIRHDHWRFQSGTKLWHDEIQTAIETVARVSGAELIDFHAPLYPHPDLLPDALHPNPEGAGIMARTVFSAITGDYGGLRLSPVFTDYMVLPRDARLKLSGTADAGSQIAVSIAGQTATGVANNRGEWSVTLEPIATGNDYTLTVSAMPQTDKKAKRKAKPQTLTFRHVAAGEVWLCSGQSNMTFRLNQADTGGRDIPQAADPDLRLFNMRERWTTYDVAWPMQVLDSIDHLQYFDIGAWQPSTPESAAKFSAVAYYFGRMLRDSLRVPVGLICNAVGGAGIEAYIDRQTIETEFPNILRNWTRNDFLQGWVRERALRNISADTARIRRHPYEPCYLYEAGVLPLQQYPIKGVIWYQGESNAHNADTHTRLFELLAHSWRTTWNNPDLPIYYVQLSSLNRPSWTWFRDSQRRLMDLVPHTGMAVSSDCGDSLDVHPCHKQPVGERLARWALNRTYGHSLTPSGPLPESLRAEGDTLVVTFRYGQGLFTSDGQAPRTFEIAHDDGLFHPAQVIVRGNTVMVYSPAVHQPRFVRYGWQPFTRANLVNSDGLPASTFRLELKEP